MTAYKMVKLLQEIRDCGESDCDWEEYGLFKNRVFFVLDTFKDIVWVRADNDKLVALYKNEYVYINWAKELMLKLN